MIVSDLNSFMGAETYITEARKMDLQYSFFVEKAVSYLKKEINFLNEGLASEGLQKFEGEVRIKNSDIMNSEVSPYAFILNSGLFYSCYKMDLSKYLPLFQEVAIRTHISQNPHNLPFMFILLHELSHIFRNHNYLDKNGLDSDSFIQATEMDADLIATAKLYRRIQSSRFYSNDLEARLLVIVSIMEALNAMKKHSDNSTYQNESVRFHDVILKASHLKKEEFSNEPLDTSLTAPSTLHNLKMIGRFLSNYRYKISNNDSISEFINETMLYCSSPERAGTFKAWDAIKDQVSG